MKGMTELMTKQQSGGKKLNIIAGNAEGGEKMGSQAGNENAKWRESSKIALIVVYEETMCLRNKSTSMTKQAHEDTRESEIKNGLGNVQARPSRRKWKLHARNPNNNRSGNKVGQVASKQPSGELEGLSPKQKKMKLTSPLKSVLKQYKLHSLVAKLKLSWEPLAMKEKEEAVSNTTKILAEASGHPR